jgi:hypothetical protein
MIGIVLILGVVATWGAFLMVCWCLMPAHGGTDGRNGLRWPWSKYSDPPHINPPLVGPRRGVTVDFDRHPE